MSRTPGQDRAIRREMAASLDCFIEEDFQDLSGTTESTLVAWRKRGTGPAYVRLGKNYLYPRPAVVKFLEARTSGSRSSGKDLL